MCVSVSVYVCVCVYVYLLEDPLKFLCYLEVLLAGSSDFFPKGDDRGKKQGYSISIIHFIVGKFFRFSSFCH